MVKYSDLSDKDLVLQCKKEIPETTLAFDEVVRRYKNWVFKIAYDKLANQEDAEDAAQEAFVRIFFNLKAFRLESSLKTWVTKITLNVCLTILLTKKRKFWRSHVSLDGDADIETIYDTMITAQQERSFMLKVGRILRKMITDYRKVFILKFFKALSIKKIASVIRNSIGGTKMKIKRAKDQFLELFKKSS